jgi:hypothetical protein
VIVGALLFVAGMARAGENLACKTVTTAELREITGVALADGVPVGEDAETSQCGWSHSAGGYQVTVYFRYAEAAYDQMKALPGFAPVAGVGDRAMWSPVMHTFMAQKGKKSIALKFNFMGGDQKTMGTKLAKLALGRI